MHFCLSVPMAANSARFSRTTCRVHKLQPVIDQVFAFDQAKGSTGLSGARPCQRQSGDKNHLTFALWSLCFIRVAFMPEPMINLRKTVLMQMNRKLRQCQSSDKRHCPPSATSRFFCRLRLQRLGAMHQFWWQRKRKTTATFWLTENHQFAVMTG